ncbi:MAG TPA: hypothetical protein VMQ51_19345 [Candidatus Binatia bacterium]|nr:hypothetical protein [Candidatus Binatia bacterium]
MSEPGTSSSSPGGGEGQDTQVLSALAERLATRLDTWALAVLNHDDDVL